MADRPPARRHAARAGRPDLINRSVGRSGKPADPDQPCGSRRAAGARSIPGDYRITGYEEPTRLDFEVIAGPARPSGRFDLREVAANTTEVTFTLDLKPQELMVLMTALINKQVRSEVANITNVPRAMGESG
jgi:hypothetical protein